MRRWLGWIAIAWLLALCALALFAYGSPASGQSLDDRTLAIASQFRCPVCEGETVADSSSGVSRAIRADIRQRLTRGESEAQIDRYILSRYPGSSLAPSTSGIGGIAWYAPPLLLLGGLGLLSTLVIDWRMRGRHPAAPVRPEYLERVRSEVELLPGE